MAAEQESGLLISLHHQTSDRAEVLHGDFQVRSLGSLERLIAILVTFRPCFEALDRLAEMERDATGHAGGGEVGG